MEREYFYTIDLRGNLIHDNSIIDDGEYIDYFYKRMKRNDSENYKEFPYVSICGRELNYVRPADTPIVFHRLYNGMLYYGYSHSVEFSRENLRFSRDGILYHISPIGEIGRLSTQVVMELATFIQPFGEYYRYNSSEDTFPWVIEPTVPIPNKKILRPRAGNRCAGCGQDSPNGLFLSFIYDCENKTAETWLLADERLEGSLGIMHGGYVSLLLDEAMGKTLSGLAIRAPTANLNVSFRKPTPIGKLLHLRGSLVDIQGRKHFLKGELFDSNNQLLAEAEGVFIALK